MTPNFAREYLCFCLQGLSGGEEPLKLFGEQDILRRPKLGLHQKRDRSINSYKKNQTLNKIGLIV